MFLQKLIDDVPSICHLCLTRIFAFISLPINHLHPSFLQDGVGFTETFDCNALQDGVQGRISSKGFLSLFSSSILSLFSHSCLICFCFFCYVYFVLVLVEVLDKVCRSYFLGLLTTSFFCSSPMSFFYNLILQSWVIH